MDKGGMIISFIAFFLAISLLIVGVIATAIHDINYISYYEYIDLDNNIGIAEDCSYKFQNRFSGGQGNPVCVLEDGTVIVVKQYKHVETLKGDSNE